MKKTFFETIARTLPFHYGKRLSFEILKVILTFIHKIISFLRAVMRKVRKVAKERKIFDSVKLFLLLTSETALKI